jgi:hypothetical protein
MKEYGPEFTFDGLPVGLFKGGVAPRADGAYYYEAYRGPGHYQMHERRRSTGSALCQYQAQDGTVVSFVVVGLSTDGALELQGFSVQKSHG